MLNIPRYDVRIEPIQTWPGKLTAERRRSKFRANRRDTELLLSRELRHLDARNLILQLAINHADLRVTGELRANAKPAHPGIVLGFDTPAGPIAFPCDRYDDWTDNLRAIALALAALRAVDRYGVTRNAEQYRGWQQLPPPQTVETEIPDAEKARAFIASLLGIERDNGALRDQIDGLLRFAERKTHPDKGGDPAQFKRVQRCRQLLAK